MKLKTLRMISLFFYVTIIMSGCGSKNNTPSTETAIPSTSSTMNTEVTDSTSNTDKKDSEKSKDVIITETSIGNFTVKIILKEGTYITNELSAYINTYQGDFEFVVINNNATVFSEKIVFENSDELIALKKDFKLQTADYNSDGDFDFALGQYASSNSFVYQFYSIDKTGAINFISLDSSDGKTIEAKNNGYSPLFKLKDGFISYEVYNQDTGNYLDYKLKIK